MKIKYFALLAVMLIGIYPTFAQENTNTVVLNGYSMSFPNTLATNVNVTQFAGDAVTDSYPGGPEAPHTQFDLYSTGIAPEGYDSQFQIRFYPVATVAGYDFVSAQVTQLQDLLTNQIDLSTFAGLGGQNPLPFLPVYPAAQVINGQPQYVDTGFFTGIRYITVFRQDASPLLGNEFLYTFQGLSKDGATYVSVVAHVNTALFPSELGNDFNYDTFIAGIDSYYADSIATLNQALPSDFTPNLNDLDALVQTLQAS